MPTGAQPHWTSLEDDDVVAADERHYEPKIVVGFDNSEGSHKALQWAIKEAELRKVALSVVKAWAPGEFGTDVEIAEINQTHLDKTVSEAIGTAPITWQAIAARGSATKVLLEHARHAELLVVGSRGHGGFTGLMLGSVSIQVSTHSRAGAVVVVRDQ